MSSIKRRIEAETAAFIIFISIESESEMKIHILFCVFVVLCYVNSIESTIPGLNLGGGGGSSGIASLLGGLLGGGSGGGGGSGNILRTLIQGLAGRPGVEGDGAPTINGEESGSSDAVGDALRWSV